MLASLDETIDVAANLFTAKVRIETLQNAVEAAQTRYDVARVESEDTTQAEVILRAFFKQRTDATFGEVETLLTKGLQTVFGPEWTNVKVECTHKNGRLWGELTFVQGDVSAPPLEAFGGGPASLAAFLLRMLVARRTGLAPVLLLDESFAQVSASALPNLATFLRKIADKLGITIVLVTHQPAFLDAATRAYRATKVGDETVFTPVTPGQES